MYYFKSVKRVYSVVVMSETFISELVLKECQATKIVLESKIRQYFFLLRQVSTKTLIKTKTGSGMSLPNFIKNT